MTVSFDRNILNIDGLRVELPWSVLSTAEGDGKIFVLFDPDAYISDPNYKASRRTGAPAIRNLIAMNTGGERLWEAELPESADYYYKLESIKPLTAYSFSSHCCEIDTSNGKILSKKFYK